MNCTDVQNLIPLYCRGELSDELRRQVEEHLSDCPDCRTEKEREDTLGKTIGDSASQDPSDAFWGDYNDKVRSAARGAVGMLWKLGELPGCIAGLILSIFFFLPMFIAIPIVKCNPELSKQMANLILAVAVVTGLIMGTMVSLIARSAIKHIGQSVEKELGDDERKLRHAIAGDPSTRTAFLSAGVLKAVFLSVFLTVMFMFVTRHASLVIRIPVAMFLFCVYMAVELPKYLTYARDYHQKMTFAWWQWVLVSISSVVWIAMLLLELVALEH